MVIRVATLLGWIKEAPYLVVLLLKKYRNEIKQLRTVSIVRRNNPEAIIGLGVKVLGDPSQISLGQDTVVEDGVLFDMQYGGIVEFGARTTIRSGAIITPYGGYIRFGDGCGVQHNTVLYGHGGLWVGNLVRIAAQCFVIPMNHGIELNGMPICSQPVVVSGIKIGNDVWVGGGSLILDGVVIEDGAVIGAGSVVTKNVSVNTIIAGVPGRFIRSRM